MRSVDDEAQCSGRWPGVWITRTRDVADRELVAVRERLERVLGVGERMDRDGKAVLERKPAVSRDMVGVRVRLEDAHDPHAFRRRGLQVLLDLRRPGRRGRPSRSPVADQVGGAAQILVDELPEEEHGSRA